ncbi:FecR family protein [Rheinheimera baltica]|uniref:FecR family protein n=1 Tax=Rheinheimera baltica TaxID=67576 RepID=UPI000421870B|nr:FecR domain-containing protein [Rheinheimera baltica]
MSNIHPIHLQSKRQQAVLDEQRLEQACDWIAKLDRTLTPADTQALQQWLASSAQNRTTLLEVAALWDKMDTLQRLSDLFPQTEKKPASHWQTWALAASVATVFLLATFWFRPEHMMQDPASTPTVMASQSSYQTRVGETTTIELPDKSKLVLNTNSFVVVKYSAKARIIELQRGEIMIDVAHDTSRPLSVVAAGKIIQAVGTAFNVDVRSNHVKLMVTDGKVLVETALAEVIQDEQRLAKRLPVSAMAISKGERVDLDASGQREEKVHKVDPVDIAASLSWRTGNLIFRGETLADAVAEISRYTDIQFELADDAKLNDIHVAGMFKTGDVNGLLEVFKTNFNISHERLGSDKVLLKFAG